MKPFKKKWVVLKDRDLNPWLSIKAEVLGHLAVHPHASKDSIGGYFVVTHIPTGARLTDGPEQRKCKKLIEALSGLGDWGFTDSRIPSEMRDKVLPLLREFRG